MDSPGGSVGKKSAWKAGDAGNSSSITDSGRSPGGEHETQYSYSWLENPMDRGAWKAPVHGVTESDMTEATEHACMQAGIDMCFMYVSIQYGLSFIPYSVSEQETENNYIFYYF